ncbi:MAG: hypothetical protein ACQESR_16025 [Planctomycetota bacterium]
MAGMSSAAAIAGRCREARNVFQAVGLVRGESCPTQPVLPLVGLAADKVIPHRYRKLRSCD